MVDFVTDEDIALGWRVASVSSNVLAASAFTMPSHATVWEDARDFGAGWGSWKIPFGGWRFTYGNIGWTNGFAWVEGYFRSKFRSRTNEIRLLSERLALCPAANWSRYNLAASRAWAATNDVDGLVVTFENTAIGDDPTKIASVQMELFPRTGEVALRYDLANVGDATYTAGLIVNCKNHFVEVGAGTREVVFQRVHPDDWDMDGIPNSIDDAPREPSPNTGYNQTDAWAMAAFPSNSTEIATMGYADWVAARATETNRHLIGLQVSSPENVWPICLTFGDKQVMCDGSEMLYFAIDDGARYSFELSDGALAAVDFDGSEMLGALPVEWYSPWEYQSWPSMVTLHVDSARYGWIGRTAEVSVDGLDDSHFFPNSSETVTAVVTNCQEEAYIDCTWIGGEGISFSDNHSLSTTIYWNSTNGVAWATNYVDLVTTYEGGYAITNRHGITVGPQTEPTTEFSIGCQKVFFLNDADFLVPGECPTNRPERIRPVTLRLVGARGTGGHVSIVNEGAARAVLFQVEDGVTNRIDGETRIRLDVDGDSFTRESVKTVYMSCPVLGRGTLRATWEPDEDDECSSEADYQVIEPIRKLVWPRSAGNLGFRLVENPSRLVCGTNAVLCVGVNVAQGDEFALTNVQWTVSGAAEKVATSVTNGFSRCVVRPVGDSGEATVVASFNGDEVQPEFVLPVVRPRTIPVRMFVVEPPELEQDKGWETSEISRMLPLVNYIFSQVGIRFELQGDMETIPNSSQYWTLNAEEYVWEWTWSLMPFQRKIVATQQSLSLMSHYTAGDCVEIYFTGEIRSGPRKRMAAFRHPHGIVFSKSANAISLAHELGHALGLKDCYDYLPPPHDEEGMAGLNIPIFCGCFTSTFDWGRESGVGFYRSFDTHSSVMRQLLMYGRMAFISELSGYDIPDGEFEGLSTSSADRDDKKSVPVGARNIEPVDGKVYSK